MGNNIIRDSKQIIQEEGSRVFAYKALKYALRKMIRPYSSTRRLRKQFGLDEFAVKYSGAPFERVMFFDLLENIGENDIFYDVGANRGRYSVVIASVIPNGEVIAFEPGDVANLIEKKLTPKYSNITVVRKAVSAKTGQEADLEREEYKPGTIVKMTHDSKSETALPTISGHEILEDEHLPSPNVVKIDVRGADLDVLRGLRPLFNKKECRLVYFEMHLPSRTIIGEETQDTPLSTEQIRTYLSTRWSFDEMLEIFFDAGFNVEYLDVDHALYIKAFKPEDSPKKAPDQSE